MSVMQPFWLLYFSLCVLLLQNTTEWLKIVEVEALYHFVKISGKFDNICQVEDFIHKKTQHHGLEVVSSQFKVKLELYVVCSTIKFKQITKSGSLNFRRKQVHLMEAL